MSPPLGACDRLVDALLDGSYDEAPSAWAPHLAGCGACRDAVAGHRYLCGLFASEAGGAPSEDGARRDEARATVRRALDRNRRRRRWRASRFAAAAAAVLALAFVTRSDAEARYRLPADPMARAMYLFRATWGYDRGDLGRLKRDPEMRALFVRALDDESSIVRRFAIDGLLESGVAVDARHIDEALTSWGENLLEPLELAASADGGRYLGDALRAQRTETLANVLEGLIVTFAQGHLEVDASHVVPFLDDPDARVRRAAVLALEWHPGYAPGPEMERLVERDPDPEVRRTAAGLLLKKRGGDAVPFLVGTLRSHEDPKLESFVAYLLGAYDEGRALSRDRLASRDTEISLAMVHLTVLWRAGEKQRRDDWIARALSSPSVEAHRLLSELAARAGWDDLWDPLEACWDRDEDGFLRDHFGADLVDWDLARGEDGWLERAQGVFVRSGRYQGITVSRSFARFRQKTPSPAVVERTLRFLHSLGIPAEGPGR